MSNHHPTTNSSPDSTGDLPFVLNPDGTVTRFYEFPSTAATPDPASSAPVLSKDVPVNPQNNTSVRIFLPRQGLDGSSSTAKLPLVVFFHGGGFVICSPATCRFHDFCNEMAIEVGVVVVSVQYRLAPEHRLPAAYDDAMEALHWIRTSDDEWLNGSVDFSNCFLMGNSAGGNIAYHAGLRAAAAVDDLVPLKIKGLVLHQPYFGGSERTASELRSVNDGVLPLNANDRMWELSLPIGSDRDHEYSNLTVSVESNAAEKVRLLGWKVMVTGCDGDPLIDRQRELAKVLEKRGVYVMSSFDEGGDHGAQLLDPTRVKLFFGRMKSFVHS